MGVSFRGGAEAGVGGDFPRSVYWWQARNGNLGLWTCSLSLRSLDGSVERSPQSGHCLLWTRAGPGKTLFPQVYLGPQLVMKGEGALLSWFLFPFGYRLSVLCLITSKLSSQHRSK